MGRAGGGWNGGSAQQLVGRGGAGCRCFRVTCAQVQIMSRRDLLTAVLRQQPHADHEYRGSQRDPQNDSYCPLYL